MVSENPGGKRTSREILGLADDAPQAERDQAMQQALAGNLLTALDKKDLLMALRQENPGPGRSFVRPGAPNLAAQVAAGDTSDIVFPGEAGSIISSLPSLDQTNKPDLDDPARYS